MLWERMRALFYDYALTPRSRGTGKERRFFAVISDQKQHNRYFPDKKVFSGADFGLSGDSLGRRQRNAAVPSTIDPVSVSH